MNDPDPILFAIYVATVVWALLASALLSVERDISKRAKAQRDRFREAADYARVAERQWAECANAKHDALQDCEAHYEKARAENGKLSRELKVANDALATYRISNERLEANLAEAREAKARAAKVLDNLGADIRELGEAMS